MSVRLENYLIYGCEFGEEFTTNFWGKDFYDEMVWNNKKPKSEPFFITDGMDGVYTFFGFIHQLSDGFDNSTKEIDLQHNRNVIVEKLQELYPDMDIPNIRLYYLPHYV